MKSIAQRIVLIGAVPLFLISSAAMAGDVSEKSDDAAMKEIMSQSFKAKGMAKMEWLEQNDAQKACTEHWTKPLDPKRKAAMEKAMLEAVKYPADGKFLGDWKNGQKLASKGKGMTWRDKPGSQIYGNCYACHQLETAQVSFGNIGPSLNNYGKNRGNTPEMIRYTWARLWNSHAFNLCNAMPKFGANGILTESELKDLMALLHDPASVVNK